MIRLFTPSLDLSADLERQLDGGRRHLLGHQVPDRVVDGRACDRLAVRLGTGTDCAIANVPGLELAARVPVANAHVLPTAPADGAPLQKRAPLTRRRCACDVVAVGVRREQPEVLLVSVPADVPRMGVGDAGEPIVTRALPKCLPPVHRPAVGTLAVRIGAGVPRVVQGPHRRRSGEWSEDHTGRGATKASGEAKALVPERLDRLVRRADTGEGLEEVNDRFSHLRVRIEDDGAAFVVDEAGGKGTSILTAPDFVQNSSAQSRLQDVKLRFAHRSLETEKETVVEVRRIVNAILVEDQRVGQGADLEQAMPVGVVPGEPRDLEPHHDARAAESDIRHEPPKPLPPRRGCARLSLVGIDHDHLIVGPAERRSARPKRILPLRALDVLDHLLHRRLSDVQVGVTLEMM